MASRLLRALYLKRRFQIGFAHRCWPYSADDDDVSTNRVNNFSSPENEFPPSTFAQFIQNRSRFWMLKKNLRAIVDAESDACRRFWIATRDVADDCLNVARRFSVQTNLRSIRRFELSFARS
jgi:hypothetical protein